MTEEEKELIKKLENQIELVYFPANFGKGTFSMNIDLDDLKILLKVIARLQKELEQEKEKNKELELCLKSEEKYSEGLNRDIKSLLNIEPNTNFISKDKIRNKIKEYKDLDKKEFVKQGNFDCEIGVLEDLLKEN